MAESYPSTDAEKRQWKPARPTLHRGVMMRSRLEAGFAQWCDDNGIDWQYEPFALSTPYGQWLPDFVFPKMWWLDTAELRIEQVDVLVEVKPEGWSRSSAVLKRMANVDHDCNVVLAEPGGFFSVWPWGDDETILHPLDLSLMLVDPTMAPVVAFLSNTSPTPPWHGEWWKGP